jgi:hypothetical protein
MRHHASRRLIMWIGTPGDAVANDVAETVEVLERMLALRRVLAHQGQVWNDQRPFVVGHIRWVRYAIMAHPTSLDRHHAAVDSA